MTIAGSVTILLCAIINSDIRPNGLPIAVAVVPMEIAIEIMTKIFTLTLCPCMASASIKGKISWLKLTTKDRKPRFPRPT